jgi:mannose-6-phosphate isomerase-like protein (cupin superfamily)
MKAEVREAMRGGTGSVEILHVFRTEELRGKARLVARLRLARGSSIGLHRHDNEEEIFYIISGAGVVTDDGNTTRVGPGDAVLTGGGASHSIGNQEEEPLELMAVILPF